MIESFVSKRITCFYLVQRGLEKQLIRQVIPLHDKEQLNQLRETWVWPKNVFSPQPIGREINNFMNISSLSICLISREYSTIFRSENCFVFLLVKVRLPSILSIVLKRLLLKFLYKSSLSSSSLWDLCMVS